jgi:hypothetical protein
MAFAQALWSLFFVHKRRNYTVAVTATCSLLRALAFFATTSPSGLKLYLRISLFLTPVPWPGPKITGQVRSGQQKRAIFLDQVLPGLVF